MVSNVMLVYLCKRLQEIFRNDKPFGGLTVVVVGKQHLYVTLLCSCMKLGKLFWCADLFVGRNVLSRG